MDKNASISELKRRLAAAEELLKENANEVGRR
jgi:hypothetical protein